MQVVSKQTETDEALLAGALAVARQIRGGPVDADAVRHRLEYLADAIHARYRSRDERAIQAYMHRVLFDELGFQGDPEEYDELDNLDIVEVLQSRRGMPIMLSMVYVLLARQLGLPAWGVGLPGHFVVGARVDGLRQIIDPFYGGRMLSETEARELCRHSCGADLLWDPSWLDPVSHRAWLTRILNNVRIRIEGGERYMACTELLFALHPGDPDLAEELSIQREE